MQPIFEAKPQRYNNFRILQGFLRENHCLFDCRADSCSAIQSFTLWPVRCLKATLKVR